MRRVVLTACAVLLCGALALADAPQTGVVTGTVTGPDGAPIPGATVQLQSDRGTMTAVTGAEGKFRFVFLVPGEYIARADLSGFQPAAGEITVSAGGRADVQLKLGEVMGEEILVTGEAPLVDRFDMTGGGTIEAKELQSITGQAQHYRSRLLFLPDVINEEDNPYGGRPSIAGQRGARQMYFIDGVDVSFARWGGGSQLNLPATSVAEMKLEATGADAQFSRTIGSYTETTVRSGTNDFHGSGYYQMQNLKWNANNQNVDVPRPDDIKDGFDISVGGPIVRDKLFFFLGYREVENPGWEVMANGIDTVESGSDVGSKLIKLDWRPNASHSVAAMYVLTPNDFPWWDRFTYADRPTVALFEYPGDITTLRWNWAITDSLLLTAHAARTTAEQNRAVFEESNIEPGCGPHDPCGNSWVYRPLDGDRLLRNGFVLPLGVGYTEFPRDQVNAALDIFAGVHQIKAGVDYQKLEWDVAGVTSPFCRGRGYDEYAPGGYLSNQSPTLAQRGWCRFYPDLETWQDGWGPSVSGSENLGLFALDTMAFDRWTLNLGVRVDQQVHHNDVDETVLDNTNVAPRIAASYDLSGDSTLLLSATAGRYYAHIQASWAAAFNRGGTGRVAGSPYDQYYFNPETGLYDLFYRHVAGSADREIKPVEPMKKDEVTLGLEWQFHRDWAFKVLASYWESDDFPQGLYQVDEEGELYESIENTPGAKEERTAITFSVQRRFRNNWMVAASYVYSDAEGTCDYTDNLNCNPVYGELLHFTNDDGEPWSYYNRDGKLRRSRPHNIKLRGAYNWQLGKGHSIDIGGLAYYYSGNVWQPWENLTDPETSNNVAVYMEPRGSRRVDASKQLDLTLQWSFPIAGSFNGFVRGEILNVTDEQAQTGIAGMAESCDWPIDNVEGGSCTATPTPTPTGANFQIPRYVRLQIGFNF